LSHDVRLRLGVTSSGSKRPAAEFISVQPAEEMDRWGD
jgi:hypothetical protein